MLQLTGSDASFLHMESGTTFGHVASLCVYDAEHPGAGYEATKASVAARLHLLPPFRRRLVDVPLGLDNPYWIEDPDFDLEYHVRHAALPAPGDDAQLGQLISRIIGRHLDRRRPLWELYVIEGLEGGRRAHLTKIHHAAIDGAAGVQLLSLMLDPDPDAPLPEAPDDSWQPEREPTPLELLARTAAVLAARPEKRARLAINTVRGVAKATENPLLRAMVSRPVVDGLRKLPQWPGRPPRTPDPDERISLPAGTAPRTSFNATITPHRKVALRTLPFDDVRKVKSTHGVTVNDVVMALCGGALRTYLQDRGELPDEPLVAFVPVSLRTGQEDEIWSNRVSGLMASLHTHVADPVERLLAIHESMATAKELHNALPAEELVALSTAAPPALAARAARVTARLRLADRTNPPFNVAISNVPGPRIPLYNSGSRLLHFYPVSTIGDGAGMNITVQSYLDNLDVGIVVCRELVPEPELVTEAMAAALQELAA